MIGSFRAVVHKDNVSKATGCFSGASPNLTDKNNPDGDTYGGLTFTFNASSSSSVYGQASKVQTRGCQLLMIIKN